MKTFQANITIRPNATFIQPTVVNQQSVQSIPTQTFYSQVPQIQQTYNLPPTNFNQGLNATPIYFVDRPAVREIPYFKHHTLEQFNKYLVNFENQCAKIYPDNQEQWRTMLINKMSKEIKATLTSGKPESSVMSKFWRLVKAPNEKPTIFSAKLCQNYEQINWEGNNQNIIQGLESVNFSVPPPSCNFMPDENNNNQLLEAGHVGYAGVGSNPDCGSVPDQPIQAQQDGPKNNFIICPHYNIQDNKNCHFCKNSHPELLKLEKVIASYDNNFIAPSTVPTTNKSSMSTVPNNVQSQLNVNNNSEC
ncbi:unnamed protein product [Rotaria magnacalcarata]|uniref:Uncharacterized protein n=1 Tax=Rotaria magnacalcarata TaxID=392030 RepID=A0A816ME59_9BILA|nr:unnamed protein product [Rotaria magnacalcarata]